MHEPMLNLRRNSTTITRILALDLGKFRRAKPDNRRIKDVND